MDTAVTHLSRSHQRKEDEALMANPELPESSHRLDTFTTTIQVRPVTILLRGSVTTHHYARHVHLVPRKQRDRVNVRVLAMHVGARMVSIVFVLPPPHTESLQHGANEYTRQVAVAPPRKILEGVG